jgi:hypothetical protein
VGPSSQSTTKRSPADGYEIVSLNLIWISLANRLGVGELKFAEEFHHIPPSVPARWIARNTVVSIAYPRQPPEQSQGSQIECRLSSPTFG